MIPDQRCTASLRYALHRIRETRILAQRVLIAGLNSRGRIQRLAVGAAQL
jgi:hypothetical protein